MLYLGILWQHTSDLAAPLVAALVASSVDFSYLWRGSQSGLNGNTK